ncbi:MAG: hypothetical protein CMLOHMNK_02001 [Steroidobacteraceae bacterium]|nr:hypothetical protein [Steroidobacteraceae bacterium]
MRIVADTNTVVSGLLWQGPPRQIINAAREQRITLHTSLFLLAELADARPLPAAVSRYPDDDHVLACALASQATLIVSGDNDLLTFNAYRDIPIVSAAEAMRRVEAQR